MDDDEDFIAPQNSTVEGFRIPRQSIDPLRIRNSAPPTVTTTPHNSFLHLEKKKDEEEKTPESPFISPREVKDGISFHNSLQDRLYQYPSRKATPIGFKKINTFISKRNINTPAQNQLVPNPSNRTVKKEVSEDNVENDNKPSKNVKQDESHNHLAVMTDEDYEYDSPMFPIIYKLFKRLGWPCDGILEGKVPKPNDKSIDTQIKHREDDGKFVYCVMRHPDLLNPLHDPYDIIPATAKDIIGIDCYFTISASHFSKVSSKKGTRVTPILEWMATRTLYYKINRIPVFKQFRLWKAFRLWRMILKNDKNINHGEQVKEQLIISQQPFIGALVDIQTQCQSLCQDKETGILDINLSRVYNLDEFCELQQQQCLKCHQKLTSFRSSISVMLLDILKSCYDEELKKVEQHIMDLKNQQKVKKKPKIENRKNSFKYIQEKYKLNRTNDKSNPRKPQPKEEDEPEEANSFKFTRRTLLKIIFKKLYRFIRLVDFIVMDHIRRMTLRTMQHLQQYVLASFNKDRHPFQKEVFDINGNTGNICHPLFRIVLTLCKGNGLDCGNTSNKLSPTFEDIQVMMENLFEMCESTINIFPSLHQEPLIKNFLNDIEMDLNSNIIRDEFGDVTDWPRKQILFGSDEMYQGCLVDINERINQSSNMVNNYIKQFEIFHMMISTANFEELERSLQKEWSVDQFDAVLQQFTEQVNAMESMPLSNRRGLFTVESFQYKEHCLPYPKSILQLVNRHLASIANEKNEAFLKIIRNGERNLNSNINTVEEFVDHLTFLSRLSDDIPKLEIKYTEIIKLFNAAFHYKAILTEEEKALYKTLGPCFHQLKSLVMYCEAKKDSKIQSFSEELDTIIEGFSRKLHQLANQIRNPSLLEYDPSYDVMETIVFLKEDLQQLSDKAKSFANYEESFSSALSASKNKLLEPIHSIFNPKPVSKVVDLQNDLSIVEKDLMLRQLLWQSLNEWDQLHQKWIETAFNFLDVNLLQKEVTRFVQTIYLMEKGLPPNQLVPSLKTKVHLFKYAMPVVISLRNPALKSRHWDEITCLIGVVIKGDKYLTLGRLLDLQMFAYKDRISEISSQASNEQTLEQMLQKVIDFWKKTDLELLAHSSRDVAIISGIDEIISMLDDSMVTISNIRGSRFHLFLQAQVNEWERKLNLFSRTFEEWVSVQRNWLYLETVFSAQDIQRQLPQEAKLFAQVDKNWRDIMRRTIDKPNALQAATSSGLLEVLQGCSSTLEKIHHSLEDYLETKRLVFSRFYFLSNDELLDILANSKNVKQVQVYLPKCFFNVNRLKFGMTQRAPVPICGMISEEGEYMELTKSLKARGQVEQWLTNVESAMFDSVRNHLKKSLPELHRTDFMKWIYQQHGQIVLTSAQITFTSEVETILRNSPKTNSNDNQSFSDIEHGLKRKLDRLATVVLTESSLNKRNVIISLMILLVHERDTVKNLIAQNVNEHSDFQWNRQLRYYWDDKQNNCFINQSIASFTYGYEYLGCTSRLVITPLTDRCFLTLTGAMHFHLGGAPTGPAGTGKSESVKDLAKALGKQCIVFNCSEDMGFKVMGRLLSGLAQSGSWCCLDEFNRIDREVLSVVAQQMHILRTAKLNKSVRFMFEGRDIRLNPTCGVFITMNPGYAGRQELPDNLKSLFRPVSMVIPDNTLIAEICLLSNGFTAAMKLSNKLVNIYELCKRQLSKQDHYDFGLRAIKAVLIMAGEKNRSRKTGSLSSIEERILKQAIQDSIQPKLITDDLKIFQQLFHDAFPTNDVNEQEPCLIEKAIGIALRELQLQRWPSQIQKALQFHSILNVRHGVMLVGPTAGGKTTVRKLLRHALFISDGLVNKDDKKEKSKSDVVSMVTINPKALTLGELYGQFDANTAEWTDGILSYAIRNYALQNTEKPTDKEEHHGKEKSKEDALPTEDELKAMQGDKQFGKSLHQWIVFDGPVDTLWVENLNTVLDDTKLLCLSNGERISMLPSMKVIFEVDSLVHASPATISRCGMVFMDPQDLGWQPSVKSWLNKLRVIKIPEEQRDYLWSLFEISIEPGLQFLRDNAQHRFTDVPDLSVVQMLCNLLDAFLHYIYKEGGLVESEESEQTEDSHEETGDNMLIDFSTLMFNYGGMGGSSNKNKKTKKRLYIQQDPANIEPFLCKLFIFSYTWSFGGHFNCLDEEAEEINKYCHIPSFEGLENNTIRQDFDQFARDIFDKNTDVVMPAGANLLYSYYVDFEKGSFMLWDHLVLNATLTSEADAQTKTTSLIPTPSTLCYTFLISLLSLHGVPLLLAGHAGYGKTTIIKETLSKLNQPGGSDPARNSILGAVLHQRSIRKANDANFLFQEMSLKNKEPDERVLTSTLTFSALTSPDRPKNALLSKLSKRGRDAYGTRHGEKVILFIDDMTMPKADEFGAQPPLEILRDQLVYSGFFHTKELHWKNIFNTTLVAACGGGQKDVLVKNKRLLQKFSTLCLPHPSAQALHHVYYTRMTRVIDPIDFTPEVITLRSGIISTLLGIFNQLTLKLRTIPAKSHYMFNIRDITKVVTGVLHASSTVIRTKDQFIELLIHETSRIFLDRLINEEDENIFNLVLLDQIHDFLKTKWNKDRLLTNKGIFGDFVEINVIQEKRVYQCIRDQKKLVSIIEDYYDRARVAGRDIPMNLVLFPQYCQHIVAAARVLRQTGGHLLMIGIGGTGKKSVIQLASYMQFCEFYQPTVSKNYCINDFKEDIKKVLLKAGVEGIKMTFFLNDRNIVQESFMEYVCSLMSGSGFSNFFDSEGKENISVKLRSDQNIRQSSDDSMESLFELFKQRVKQNLHVVFSTSPFTEHFQERCRVYPAIINHSTVDWYNKWPAEALSIVAEKFILDKSLQEAINIPREFLDILVFTHSTAKDMCKRFLNDLGRHFHVTPKSFLDFILLFKKIFLQRKAKKEFKLERLRSGLLKLEYTNENVLKMQDELISLGPILEQKTKATEDLMVEIEEDRTQVDKVRAVVKKEQEVTDFETRKVESVAYEAQKDLDAALPQLEAATAALDTLNKYDIGEIRSYAKPPVMVMTVLSAVCIILSEKPDWPTAKLLLADPGFLKKLINFDYNNVDDKIYTRIKRYTKKSDFNPIAVGKISVACKSLCTWVLALEHYTAVSRMVRPKQEKCREAQQALQRALKNLASKEASLQKVEEQLQGLEKRYGESVQQLEDVKNSKALTIKRLQTADLLINALTSEKDRWAESIGTLDDDTSYLITDAFLTAAGTAYLGAFPPDYRVNFFKIIEAKIKDSENIKIRDGFQLSTSVTSQIQIQGWLNFGLPHDTHSIENALFIQTTQHWPFIIDPQRQALYWIKSMERENVLKIVDASAKNLMQVMESSIRLGASVIIQNASASLDPSLDPILKKSIVKRGNQSILTLGDSEIEYNPQFRLYILTNENNPKALPELCIKVMVVNFIVTPNGITDQILSKIVQQENPELENKRNELLRNLVQEKLYLRQLEDIALNLLHKSEGNLLDNEELIQTLDNSKTKASEIKKRVAIAEKTESELGQKRKVYLPLAVRGSLLYFIAADLASIDSMYQFSLAWFMEMFRKCLATPAAAAVEEGRRPSSARKRLHEAKEFALLSSIERRRRTLLYAVGMNDNKQFIKTMTQVITETFYRLVTFALSARHQLLFSFYLACKISMSTNGGREGVLTMEDYNALLKQQNKTKNEDIFDKQIKVMTQYSLNNLASTLKHSTKEGESEESSSPFDDFLTSSQWESIEQLSDSLTIFTGLMNHVKVNGNFWRDFMVSEAPYHYLDNNKEHKGLIDAENTYFKVSNLTNFHYLFLIKKLKPDYFTEAVSNYVASTIGREFVTPSVFDLNDLYAESDCRTPVMFILAPGADPSSHLLRFVKEVRGSALHLDMISLGRSQGGKAANAIRKAYKHKGSWVFLQNCHLALSFMPQLEQIVRELADPEIAVNSHFRLWLSSKPDPLLPTHILLSSFMAKVETPPDVKNNLQTSFALNGGVIDEHLFDDGTIHPHWKQLVYSACFFHAVVQGRRKFGAYGWNTAYDFITPDLEMAVSTIQEMLYQQPDVKFKALETLAGEIIYGGRVLDPWDKRCLNTLFKAFFCKGLSTEGFSYLQSKNYKPPSSADNFMDCVTMIDQLPAVDEPQIFGMNENVVFAFKEREGVELLEQLSAMQSKKKFVRASSSSGSNDELILKRVEEILNMLPNVITISTFIPHRSRQENRTPKFNKSNSNQDLKKNSSALSLPDLASPPSLPTSMSPSVSVVLQQEQKRFNNLFSIISTSLTSLHDAMKGNVLFNETLEEMAKCILQNKIPLQWLAHCYCTNKSLSSWVTDLRIRVQFISRWLECVTIHDVTYSTPPRSIWLPALFYPQGILTAVLQSHARNHGIATDALTFKHYVTANVIQATESSILNIFQASNHLESGISVFGLFLDGAKWDNKNRFITKCTAGTKPQSLPEIHFIPCAGENASTPYNAEEDEPTNQYLCPLYQTSKRYDSLVCNFTNFVTSLVLPSDPDHHPDALILNGVAALCQIDE